MKITRKLLSEMTTQGLYDLSGKLTKEQDMIKSELTLRGDY